MSHPWKRGLVLVEGQAEEAFVTRCLRPHLSAQGLWLEPTLVHTNRRRGQRGGVKSYGKVANDLRRLLFDSDASVITTLIDYYALPPDFPGMATRPRNGGARACVEHVEAAWAAETNDPRFIPHITLHELEAWVFAAPGKLEPRMFDDRAETVAQLASIARAHATPEDIDDGPTTAPSKRLESVFRGFQKTYHGILALESIGIAGIRAACPHARAWLERLDAVADAAAPPA